MLGEIIAVGEEVLSGDVINSNAAYISSQLFRDWCFLPISHSCR